MKLLFLILFFMVGCGEEVDVEIYESSCPRLERGEWIGEIELKKEAFQIAYWSCVEGVCSHHESYYVKAWLETPKKAKVCCGMVNDRVDRVRLVITE